MYLCACTWAVIPWCRLFSLSMCPWSCRAEGSWSYHVITPRWEAIFKPNVPVSGIPVPLCYTIHGMMRLGPGKYVISCPIISLLEHINLLIRGFPDPGVYLPETKRCHCAAFVVNGVTAYCLWKYVKLKHTSRRIHICARAIYSCTLFIYLYIRVCLRI